MAKKKAKKKVGAKSTAKYRVTGKGGRALSKHRKLSAAKTAAKAKARKTGRSMRVKNATGKVVATCTKDACTA